MKLTGTEQQKQMKRQNSNRENSNRENSNRDDGRCGYLLLIGYGNSLRRDDGGGVAMAQRLAHYCWCSRGLPVRLLTVTQLGPELAADLAAEDIIAAVFVDSAARDGPGPVQVERITSSALSPSLGHQLAPAALLVYAELLYGRCPRAWLVTVPGTDYSHGEGFSPRVEQLLTHTAAVADRLLAEIEGTSYA
ncbi:MAG TPA: hydrogenase maturation protease [Caldilineaceae bacterium]|nr:hydrogenase maturation protease [Caldilineaceae bacterium]